MLAPVVGIPALLGNPYFMMTEFLKERMGEHEYKAPRRDGNQRLVIDEALIEEFAELEAVQFDHCNPYYKDRVWGLFGKQDTLAHFSSIYFPKSFLMIAPPIFLSIPCLVIGIPVFRLIFCFACVIPSALFQENVSPGIGVDFFAIV